MIKESDKPYSVAMVEPIGGHRGNELYDFGICKALTEKGYNVTLYTCDETRIDTQFSFPFVVKKVFVNIYGKTNKYIRGLNFLRGINRVVKDLNKQQCKLVHMHFYHFSWLEYIMLRKLSGNGRKVIGTIHDVETFDKYGKRVKKENYQKFEQLLKHIIVHTPYAKESLLHYFTNTAPECINVVPTGEIDFLYSTNLSKVEARCQLGLPEGKEILFFFGQIKKVKGLEILLRAFSIVVKQRPNVHLVIAGIPWKHDMADVYRIINDEKLEYNGTFIFDYIPNDRVPLYFKAADLLVLPYLKIYSSGIIIRAMGYGSCIIASDNPAFKTIIKDGYNGILFKNGDANELSEKIFDILNNKPMQDTLILNAKKTIEEKFSWKIVGQLTNEVYQKALHS